MLFRGPSRPTERGRRRSPRRWSREAGVRLSAPWLEDGVVWWLEGRAVRERSRRPRTSASRDGAPSDVVPAGFNVRTSVHEYGGGAYCIHARHRVRARTSTTSASTASTRAPSPVPITPEVEGTAPPVRRRPRHVRTGRSGSAFASATPRAIARRTSSTSSSSLPTDGSSEPRVIAGGRDFYSNPRISPDGSRLCFLAWNLPWMPWDGCELHVADLAADGDAQRRRRTSPARTARSRSGSRSGARPETSCSRAIAAAGGTSSGSATASARRSIRPRPSSGTRRGSSARARSRSSATGGSSVRTTRTGSRTSRVLDPETGDLERARPRARLAGGVAVRLRRGRRSRPRRRLGDDPEPGRARRRRDRATSEVLRASADVAREHRRTSPCRARSSSRPRAA